MKYSDGQVVKLGDKVRLGEDDGGFVVCMIEEGKFTKPHSKDQWGYLKTGAMIEFPLYGLIHYEKLEQDIQLISRAQPPDS